jgi:hypothetical protein
MFQMLFQQVVDQVEGRTFRNMDKVTFQQVRTEEEFEQVKRFAATFQHVIGGPEAQPLVMMFRGDKMFGYFHILQRPCISFAFHPDVTTPRDFKEAGDAIRSWQQLNSITPATPNGVCYALLPEHPVISPEIIRKMGFEDREMKLYTANG